MLAWLTKLRITTVDELTELANLRRLQAEHRITEQLRTAGFCRERPVVSAAMAAAMDDLGAHITSNVLPHLPEVAVTAAEQAALCEVFEADDMGLPARCRP